MFTVPSPFLQIWLQGYTSSHRVVDWGPCLQFKSQYSGPWLQVHSSTENLVTNHGPRAAHLVLCMLYIRPRGYSPCFLVTHQVPTLQTWLPGYVSNPGATDLVTWLHIKSQRYRRGYMVVTHQVPTLQTWLPGYISNPGATDLVT